MGVRSSSLDRRTFLKHAGIGTGAAVAATVLVKNPAHAQTVANDGARVYSGTHRLPGLNIPAGQVVRFDPNVSTTLELTANCVVEGKLEMKPANPGVVHTLRFVGIDESRFVGGSMDVLASDVGLWVMGAGQLDIQGSPKDAWNRTGFSATWRASDELVVTPVNKGDYAFRPFSAGGAVPSVSLPFGNHKAEILNLTRNVFIEGTPTGRSHVFIRSTKPQMVRYATIRHMGPQGLDHRGRVIDVLGRYCLHFHHCMEGSRGSFVEGVVARDSGSHGYVPHMSYGVTFRDCIAYKTSSDAYWWDAGEMSEDIVFENCVAAQIHALSAEPFKMSGFMLGKGTNLVVRRCVSVGVQGKEDSSGFHWTSKANEPPNVWIFEDNVAHNNVNNGIFIWQNSPSKHIVERFVAYHNGAYGISQGAYRTGYQYNNSDLMDNGKAAVLLHAVSHRAPAMGFTNVRMSGTSAYLVETDKHFSLEPENPTFFRNCTLTGGTTKKVMARGITQPDLLDFEDCNVTASDISVPATAIGATTIRLIQDGRVKQVIKPGNVVQNTDEPAPQPEPTTEPTPEPSPTPTTEPSPTPTATPSPTPTAEPSPTPTATPSPTPTAPAC